MMMTKKKKMMKKKKNNNIKEEVLNNIFNDSRIEITNKLCDSIEIPEKNLIIISFSKEKLFDPYNDFDYTISQYILTIIDSKNYQIIANLFDLIEAEKLLYFWNNELFSLGLRNFINKI